MTDFIELNKYFAIEESEEERFLVDNWSKTHNRLVNIGKENEVTFIKLRYSTGYYNFKVTNSRGIGLMQLKECMRQYTNIAGTKKCDDNVLQLNDVLVVPTDYEDVSVDHIFERFGVKFPIARKNAELYEIFARGHKLQKAWGTTLFVNMQLSNAIYIPQIISYRNNKVYVTSEFDEVIFSAEYDKFPELCFIQNADNYSSIYPSYEEYKLNIWMYNANGKVGIVYLDSEQKVHSYIVDEVPFDMKENVYFINENYVIYNFHDVRYLYFKGQYVGQISWFESKVKHPIFVRSDKGFYLGQTFFDKKEFFDIRYLHIDSINTICTYPNIMKVTLRSGPSTYTFKYDSKIGKVVK